MIPKLYTLGHSNKTIEELIQKLVDNKIEALVDVRTIPYSKYNPQFNRENLSFRLSQNNIHYYYRGKNLGGKGGKEANTGWDKAIDELKSWAERDLRVCVMCSEADPNNCHRQSTIQPDAEKVGLTIEHILWKAIQSAKIKAEVEVVKQHTLF